MENEEELFPKLKGWYGTYRGKFLLLYRRFLTKEEFILYDASIAFADWDQNHTRTYGTLQLIQTEIEKLLGVSGGFVSKYKKRLLEIGLWEESRGRIYVRGIELIHIRLLREITEKEGIVDLQKYLAISQKSFALKQGSNAKERDPFSAQLFAKKQNSVAKSDISSYKDNVSTVGYKTDEEYSLIWEEMGNPANFTVDDMKWIDQNIK